MSGLTDSTKGLEFGTGLQFETKIGTAGLTIITTVPQNVVASDSSPIVASDGSQIQTQS